VTSFNIISGWTSAGIASVEFIGSSAGCHVQQGLSHIANVLKLQSIGGLNLLSLLTLALRNLVMVGALISLETIGKLR
jgi:hypothetical protein